MADFTAEVRRFMAERGFSLRGLAKASNYDPSYLSKVLSGHKPSSPFLAARLDDALGAGGQIRDAAQEAPPRRPRKAAAAHRRSSGAVEALRVAMDGDPDGPDIGADGLAELVRHYAHALAVAPSAAVYGDLLSARSFAGTLLGRSAPRQRSDLTVTNGWLSSLLAISAADLGDHAAAVVWCADTERRGRDAGYPELLGWAALTRSLIAWYQGDPVASAAAASRGHADGLPGSVAHVKLAAQEMRCRAMLGDAAGMVGARLRAAAAMAQLGPPDPVTSVYSVPRADNPPYTATSLLLAGRHAEAAEMTRQIIDTAYRPQARAPWDQPTNYARTLLILALAVAGLGELDQAAAAGGRRPGVRPDRVADGGAGGQARPGAGPALPRCHAYDGLPRPLYRRGFTSRAAGTGPPVRERTRMNDGELTPGRVAALTAAVDIEAPPQDREPVALVLFGTNQEAPAQIAAERYHGGAAPLVIVTGGVNRHNGIIEGREFSRQLTEAGVPGSVIRVEDQSKDTWQNVELSLPYLREALAMGLRLAVVSKWYHLRAVYCLVTLVPDAAPFYAISWEPVYAGTLVTRASWPKIPDGRRRVVCESEEVFRRVADGTYRAARKADGSWQLS
jgi:hypothetical protein